MDGKAAARMMYNPQLETFLRVADAGSFNKAAEELFITQSDFSPFSCRCLDTLTPFKQDLVCQFSNGCLIFVTAR